MVNLSLFQPCYNKLNRARKHIQSISDELGEAIANCEHTIIQVDRQNWRTWIGSPITAEQTNDIATLVGDAIHNIRAALDIMAVAAVRLNNKNPKGVYFPFAVSKDELENQIRRKNFHKAGEECVALLISLRPHGGENGNRPLRALHDADIIDKHQTVQALTQVVLQPNMLMRFKQGGRGAFSQNRIGFQAGVEPGYVWEGVPESLDYSQSGFPESLRYPLVELLFGASHPFGGMPVIPTLNEAADMANSIVNSFSEVFRR